MITHADTARSSHTHTQKFLKPLAHTHLESCTKACMFGMMSLKSFRQPASQPASQPANQPTKSLQVNRSHPIKPRPSTSAEFQATRGTPKAVRFTPIRALRRPEGIPGDTSCQSGLAIREGCGEFEEQKKCVGGRQRVSLEASAVATPQNLKPPPGTSWRLEKKSCFSTGTNCDKQSKPTSE